MSKWSKRGQFRHLHFKTFSMTPKTPQCEVFWPFNSNSEFLGVPKDSKSPLLGVWASPSHLAQSGVATKGLSNSPTTHAINPKVFRVPKMNLKNGHVSQKGGFSLWSQPILRVDDHHYIKKFLRSKTFFQFNDQTCYS